MAYKGSGSFHETHVSENFQNNPGSIGHIVMKCFSPISLGPFPGRFPRKFHLSALKREDVRILLQLLGRPISFGCLEHRFLEEQHPG